MSEALSSISKSYRSPIFFYDVLPNIWVTLSGGMAGYMESVVKYGIYVVL